MYTPYALVLNTALSTFFYASALPILIPIAALTFINIYITERLTVAYWFRRPPRYDGKLNHAAMVFLKWAPLGYFVFGYWSMGNTKIFNNDAPEQVYTNEPPNTSHTGGPWDSSDPDLVMLSYAALFIIIMTLGRKLEIIFRPCGMRQTDTKIILEESIGHFYSSMSELNRKSVIANELVDGKVLGIKTLGKASFQ